MTADFTKLLTETLLDRLEVLAWGHPRPLALHEPEFSGAEWDYVRDTLDSGWVSSAGSYVERFESQVAQACGVAHGVAVSNGTSALQVALHVAGVGADSEVLMPSLTFVATANAVSHTGATPHFVDVEKTTLGICPKALADRLDAIGERRSEGLFNRETGRRIAAIVPVHIFGHPVDVDGLMAVANSYDVPVVEDAAEGLGSLYKGRPCGSYGTISALSFNGNKILTTGGGGVVVTDNADLAKRVKHLTTTAKRPHAWDFEHDAIAWNYRLPNLNAALGCAQMEQLPDRLARKARLARRYAELFRDFDGAAVFSASPDCVPNNWLNAIVLDEERAGARDALLDATNSAGFHTRPIWRPMHSLTMYADHPRGDLSVTNEMVSRVICLPSSAHLADTHNGVPQS
jgi:perosamine synthetase